MALLDQLRDQLKPLPVPGQPVLQMPTQNPAQMLPVPQMPAVTAAPPPPNPIQATTDRLNLDQGRLGLMDRSGSGVHQILHPVDAQGNPTGQHIGLLRKIGGVLANIGDTALGVVAPGVAAAIPGTTNHHRFLMGQEQGYVNNDLSDAQRQAQTQQEQALTDYTQQRPQIEQSKIDQRQTAVQERVGQAAAARGQKVTWDANGLPSFEDDPTSQAYADHQALSAMHQATADKAKLTAEQMQNHYIPGTPEWDEYQRKMAQVDKRLGVAMASLGLRAKGLELRQNDQKANFYGVGPDGSPLPNAPQFQDDEGNVTTGGLKGAKTAITQQGKVGQFRDLGGSIQHAQAALAALHATGGDLSDPAIVMAMSDPTTVAGKIVNGKLVKANLSPAQIQAIGALNQLREQAGIFRSSTGGTSAEAQAQRILETLPTAGDTKDTANNKFSELRGVYDRLTPSVPTTAGGMSMGGRGGHHSTPASTGGTVKMKAPDGTVMPVPAGQVDHFKSRGAVVVQ